MYEVKKILCPVDFSDASTAALETAADLAHKLTAELIVFHVVVPTLTPVPGIEPEPVDIKWLNDAQAKTADKELQQLVESVSKREISVRPLRAAGEIVTSILRAAADEAADLIVMSTHGWTGWHRLLLGSVTEKIVRQAECPVMSIHPADAQAE
jgi:nucleotide-binding universal stress UspA family protein